MPNLAKVARDEMLRRVSEHGVPEVAVHLALKLRSPDGRSYDERLKAVKTERDVSLIYEQFTGEAPLGQRLFANWNPVRTGARMVRPPSGSAL